ncbi:MAG: beta-lactamase family protein [Gemmatimonadota bacterium]|nr:beta-lactamase family protein [Gemmatimonadota bacterium]
MLRTLLYQSLLLALLPASTAAQEGTPVRYGPPVLLEDGWKTAHADSLGVDSQRLAKLTESLRAWPELGVHAILIERDGRLIYEEYFDGFDERWGQPLGRVSMTRESKHDLRSVTKSVVSALTGIAVGAGAIKALEQPVVQWFPEYPELNTAERRRVTLAHVLAMTSGLEWNEEVPYNDPRNDEIRMTRDSQPLRYALSRPFRVDPGSDFTYNGGLTQVMAAVIERATRTSLEDYARTQLFEPLGITDVEWMGDLAGMPAAASGLRLRPRDIAKFGSLYLHGGRWNGKQVIPADWIQLSTRQHFRFRPRAGADAGGEFGYAYFWWYSCYPTAHGLIETRTAVGNGQQRIFVLPGLDMVVTILAGRYNDFTTGATLGTRILRQHVIPAVRTGVQAGCPGS